MRNLDGYHLSVGLLGLAAYLALYASQAPATLLITAQS